MPISKVKALKEYFSVEDKPVTGRELIQLRKQDSKGFDELAELAAKAIGETLEGGTHENNE